MNITELLHAGAVLNQLAQTKTTSTLAYKIMKFCKSVAVEEEFYNNKRAEIIKEYSVKDEQGNPVISEDGIVDIIVEKRQEAFSAMNDLNNIKVEAPNIKFKLTELEGFELSASDMFALDAFIEE